MPKTRTTFRDDAADDAERRIAACRDALAGLPIADALAILANLTARLIVEPARTPAEADRATRAVCRAVETSVAMMERDRFGGPVQ